MTTVEPLTVADGLAGIADEAFTVTVDDWHAGWVVRHEAPLVAGWTAITQAGAVAGRRLSTRAAAVALIVP